VIILKKKLKLAEAAEIAGLGHVEENEGEDSIVEQIRKIDHKQILTEITKEEKEEAKKRVLLEAWKDVLAKREEKERLEQEKLEEEERLEREKQEEEERKQAQKEAKEQLAREKEELRKKELAGLDEEIKLCPLHFGKDQPCFSNCALNVSNGNEPYCLIVMLAGAIGDITGQRLYQ